MRSRAHRAYTVLCAHINISSTKCMNYLNIFTFWVALSNTFTTGFEKLYAKRRIYFNYFQLNNIFMYLGTFTISDFRLEAVIMPHLFLCGREYFGTSVCAILVANYTSIPIILRPPRFQFLMQRRYKYSDICKLCELHCNVIHSQH